VGKGRIRLLGLEGGKRMINIVSGATRPQGERISSISREGGKKESTLECRIKNGEGKRVVAAREAALQKACQTKMRGGGEEQ